MAGSLIVSDWRNIWKRWSVRLNALGTTIVGYFILIPGAARDVWASLPPELKSAIPPRYLPAIGLILLVMSILVTPIRQKKLSEPAKPEPEVKKDAP